MRWGVRIVVYEPQEDSLLLQKFVRKFARGVVLDVGTGSGIQARTAAGLKRVAKVFATDVDADSLDIAKKRTDSRLQKKITWLRGGLFSPFRSKGYKFDTIIFNPPYLPQEKKTRHIDLEGGRKGREVIRGFLEQVNDYLKPNGIVLLVVSSLTPDIKPLVWENLLLSEQLGKVHLFFEDIIVLKLKTDPIRASLVRKGISCIRYLAKGKRGLVFTGKFRGKKVAIKIKRLGSLAKNTIPNEARMLKLVNKERIGPKYIFHTPKFLVYRFVEGDFLRDVMQTGRIKSICREILEQCFTLDRLGVDKKEWTRPLKHAIIKGSKVTIIDFERARKEKRPHNVTQFCSFIMNHVVGDKNRLINKARRYSRDPTRDNFEEIVGVLR